MPILFGILVERVALHVVFLSAPSSVFPILLLLKERLVRRSRRQQQTARVLRVLRRARPTVAIEALNRLLVLNKLLDLLLAVFVNACVQRAFNGVLRCFNVLVLGDSCYLDGTVV